MSDPIADLLTRLRNSSRARQRFVDIDWSHMKEAIVKILKDKGFVSQYLVKEEKKIKTMRIFLKYAGQQEPVMQELKRVSKPSCRQYISFREIPKVCGGLGIAILSTSQGVLEGGEARARKAGGEILCLVY
jgi:small subunit ribosomal protein S8